MFSFLFIHVHVYTLFCVSHLCPRHTFKVTRDLLLQLYDHTLEVRLWNTKEKVAPRARFDRPRAFRLPAPAEGEEDGEGHRRPDKFPIVGQESERMSHKRRRRSRISKKTSSISEAESDVDLNASISESHIVVCCCHVRGVDLLCLSS